MDTTQTHAGRTQYSDIDRVSAGSDLDDNGNTSTTGDDDLLYCVISLDPDDETEDHGGYETLTEAHGCVAYDHLRAYAIWHNGVRIECCDPYHGNDDRAKQGLGQL